MEAKKRNIREQLLTEKTEIQFYKKELLPIFQKGESAVVFFVAGAGRKRTCTYLLENSFLFDYQSLGKYLLAYIDLDELTENNEETYFLLMLKQLTKNNSSGQIISPFFALKEEVERLLKEGYKIIFIFGRFDDLDFSSLFFNNLKSLRDLDKKNVNFVFPVNHDIFSENFFDRYDRLKEILAQNIVYFPLFSLADAKLSLERRVKKYSYKVSEERKNLIIKLAGGHASLIKICLRIFNEGLLNDSKDDQILVFLNNFFEVRLVLEEIWDCLTEAEKQWLKKIVSGGQSLTENPERLQKLNIALSEENKVKLFSPLFENFIKQQKTKKSLLSFNGHTGEILADGQPLREKISLNEYRLLANFLQQKNHVFSKDDIADILWGDESFDKYSDWAIEKVLSSVRRKIRNIGIDDKKLQSIRNRGYRWVD